MANTSNTNTFDSLPMNKPPPFDGTHYNFWRTKMRNFLMSLDLDIMNVVEKEYKVPEKLDDTNRKEMALNIKALVALQNCLSVDEYTRVAMCDTAHEVWTTLETAHVGSSQVKDSKLLRLTHEYHEFTMLPNETIDSLVARFNKLITDLHNLGKKYTAKDNCIKLLFTLSSEWETKVTAILEAADLNTMTLENLISKLRVHEMDIMDKRKKKHNEEPKKKSIALKAKTPVIREPESSSESSSSEEEEDDREEMAALARKFRKFMKGQGYPKKKPFYKNKEKGKSKSTCHQCGKPGHWKSECPEAARNKSKYQGDKRKGKKKAYQALWDKTDSDSSEEEKDSKEEHIANMCFMARDDDDQVHINLNSYYDDDSDDDLDDDIDYDSMSKEKLLEEHLVLIESFEKLFSKFEKLKKKKTTCSPLTCSSPICENCVHQNAKLDEIMHENEKLKDEKNVLACKISELEKEKTLADSSLKEAKESVNTLNVELVALRSKTLELEGALTKFTKGKDILDVMLGEFSANPERQGLGFKTNSNTSSSTTFVKASTSSISTPNNFSSFVKLTPQEKKNKHMFHTCSYCLTMGHTISFCRLKKKNDMKYPYHFEPNTKPKSKIHMSQMYANKKRKNIKQSDTLHVTHSSTHSSSTYVPIFYNNYYVGTKSVKTNTAGPKWIWVPKLKNSLPVGTT